jgi:DNA-binding NarL/FixJ family response regulator
VVSFNPEIAVDLSALRVVVADDHALIRGGLALLIEMATPGAVVLEANNLSQVTEYLEQNESVDLLLLDLNMPGMRGVSDIKAMRNSSPGVPIIIVSVSEDLNSIRNALAAGAMGFIPKSSSPDVTVGAIQLVLAGGVYVPPHVLQLNLSHVTDNNVVENKAEGKFGLTPRQIEVLEFLILGKSNQAIADELGLTTGTIKLHVSAIFTRLKVSSRTEAAMKFTELKRQE